MSSRAAFLEFDDALAARGVPPLTSWWREGIGSWLDAYDRGHALELWGCVGRGAAKSTAAYKLATYFTLFGDFAIPPGERHLAVVVSRLREEAGKGIAIIAQWLTLLGVPHRSTGDTIELADMPRGLRVVAASVAGASGWRAFFLACDEYSKWASGGVEELNAGEVRSSAVAMTATHERAPVVTFASAWGAFGEFYDTITAGTDSSRVVLGPAPTWIAAPHITKESTQRKERDPKRWAREYACEFQSSATSAFDQDMVAECMARTLPTDGTWWAAQEIGIADPSSLQNDAWTSCRIGWCLPRASASFKTERRWSLAGVWFDEYVLDVDGKRIPLEGSSFRPTLRVDGVLALPGGWRSGAMTGAEAIATHARSLLGQGITHAFADQRDAMMNQSEFARHGIAYHPISWSNTNKGAAVSQVRAWMRERQLIVPKHEGLRRELLSYEERITPNGAVTYAGRGKAHDDLVALLLTSALVELQGAPDHQIPPGIPASPRVARTYRDLTFLPPA